MHATLQRLYERRAARGDEGGFTLIELLIVVVILGILAAIVVFAVGGLTSTSAQASCKTDYKTVETAVTAYYAENNAYPASVLALTQSAAGGPYLKEVPINDGHYAIQTDGAGGVDVYNATAAGDQGTTEYGTTIAACADVT